MTTPAAGPPGGTPEELRAALQVPFRPHRSRRVAIGFAVAQFVVLATVAAVLPGTGPIAFQWYDRFGMLLIAAAVAWFLLLFARIVAVPGETGLRVRNLLVVEEVRWDRITRVGFGGGGPWATLDLSDGDTVAVMAVQRSDGERGAREAERLATLVEMHRRSRPR